jgi:YbgC/YbaW family acyl-CoA thioester hydrolase
VQRIKLHLPDHFSFAATIAVRITDINYGGHLGNDKLLTLLHEARMQYLQHHGYTELNLGGTGILLADVAIEYRSEIKYGDSLKIYITATDFDKLGFDLYYKVMLEKGETEALVARAKTGVVCFDYTTGKKVAVPAPVVAKLSAS